MQDQETKAPKKGPNCERIAGQAFVLVGAEKERIRCPGDDAKKKAVRRELRRLAVVVDEERGR
jgi:hypothetical protein